MWRGGRERGKGRERESAEVFISGLGVSRSGLVELETVASGQRHSPKKNELEESGV